LVRALFKAWLPVVLAGLRVWLLVDVVPGDLGLLISRKSMESLKSVLSLRTPEHPMLNAIVSENGPGDHTGKTKLWEIAVPLGRVGRDICVPTWTRTMGTGCPTTQRR
jgi:hypothetical protein